MFEQDFLDKQKKRLLEDKASIEKTLSERGKKDENVKNMDDFDVVPPHLSKKNEPLDLDLEAQEVAGFANRISIEKNLEVRLEDINQALKRIETGKYGECENCKNEKISRERLEALPAARLCLDCEKKPQNP